MTPKRSGCCSKCDSEVFEIVKRDPETREPTQVGQPLENAIRATFIMVDGTRMDLTFCRTCMETLTPQDYPWLWRRVMLSWIAQSGADHPFVKTQANNGLMAIDHSRPWKEIA